MGLIGDQRLYLDTEVQIGNLIAYDEEDCERFEKALEHHNTALLGIDIAVEEVRFALMKFRDQLKQLRQD